MMNNHGENQAKFAILIFVCTPLIVILSQILLSYVDVPRKQRYQIIHHNDNARSMSTPVVTSSSLHLRRRIQHILTGLIFYIISFILPHSKDIQNDRHQIAIYLLSSATLIFAVIIKIQSQNKKVKQIYLSLFGSLLRENEINGRIPGAFWFLLGTTLTTMFFPLNITRTSILCLGFADPIAAIVGISIQSNNKKKEKNQYKDKIFIRKRITSKKSLEGCLACFITTFIIVFCSHDESCIYQSIITGIITTVLELSSGTLLSLDDNLLIPIGVGATLFALRDV